MSHWRCCCGGGDPPVVTPIPCPPTIFDLPAFDSRLVQVPSWTVEISAFTEPGTKDCPDNPRYLTFTGTFSALSFNPSTIYGGGNGLAGVTSSSPYIVLTTESYCWEADGSPFSDPSIVALHPDGVNDYAVVEIGYQYDPPGLADPDYCDRLSFDNDGVGGLAAAAYYVSPQPWNSENGGDFPLGTYTLAFVTVNGDLVTGGPSYTESYCSGGQTPPDCDVVVITPPATVQMVAT